MAKTATQLGREDVIAFVRNDVGFTMSRIRAHLIDYHLDQVLPEYDAAVQRGELLTFEPRRFRLGEIAEAVRLLQSGDESTEGDDE